MPVVQIINDRYVDKERLNTLLVNKFGAGNFEVDVRIELPSRHGTNY